MTVDEGVLNMGCRVRADLVCLRKIYKLNGALPATHESRRTDASVVGDRGAWEGSHA